MPDTAEVPAAQRAGAAPRGGAAHGAGTSQPPAAARAAPPAGTQRTHLTRERIVVTAVELLEREGEDALSMRRIAAELGFGVMSLYNHVPNKAALLDSIADYVMAGMQFPADPRADWRDQARALVRTFHEIARRYPRSVNLVITRQPKSAAGLRPLEVALATARAAGFDGVTAVRVMRTFVAYALGTVVNEVRLKQKRAEAAADPDWYATRVDPAEFPNTAALSRTLTDLDHEADFEFGLELLIHAVTTLPRSSPGSAPSASPGSAPSAAGKEH